MYMCSRYKSTQQNEMSKLKQFYLYSICYAARQLFRKKQLPPYSQTKCKLCHRTGHEGTEGEQRYRSTLSLTSALDRGGWPMSSPRRKTDCIGGWVGPRAGLDACGKPLLHRVSIPGPSIAQQAAISTEPSQPTHIHTT